VTGSSTDEVIKLLQEGVAYRERPTLINVPTTPASMVGW
jgi:hypothetical protein